MPASYSFGRMSDRALVEMLIEMASALDGGEGTLSLADNVNAKVSASGIEAWLDGIISHDTYLIQGAGFGFSRYGFDVNFVRGQQCVQNPQGQYVWQRASSAFIDGLTFSGPTNSPVEIYQKIVPVLIRHIGMAPPAALVDDGRSALDQAAAVLNGLNAAVQQLVAHTAERQKSLDDARDLLAEKAAEDLDRLRGVLQQTIEPERERLREREAELARREEGLDDRAYTHVRRSLQTRMSKQSEEQLTGRLLIRSDMNFVAPLIGAIAGAVFAGAIIVRETARLATLGEVVQKLIPDKFVAEQAKPAMIAALNGQALYTELRIGALGIGLAALVWFALRLATSRFRQISRWERELHKFRLDAERAGFLIEGDLEARKLGGDGLPDVLLESFSRGLFTADGDTRADAGGDLGDAITALLGQAAKVQVGPNGASVEVDRKGIRRAKKSIDDGEAE